MTRWVTFTAAPHRMMMFGGTLQLALTLLYWGAELAARQFGAASLPGTLLPSSWLHGYLMLYGLFPYFIFGFLMTTYPRWMNGPLVERPRYVASFLGMAAGSLLVYAGLFTHTALLGAGALLHAGGWTLGLLELYRVFRAAPAREKTHERYLNVYLLLGGLGMATFGLGVLLDRPQWIAHALTVGLWGFVLPLMLTVAHRMLPFFSSTVLKPYRIFTPDWVLAALPLLLAGHVACELAGLPQWRFIFDLPLAGLGIALSYRWGLWRSFAVRLLVILHLAFAWFGIGMSLYALDSLLQLGAAGFSLGRAPLHALGIGLIASMTVAMASRVSYGHSGRPLVADTLVWLSGWALHLAALLRVLGELAPGSAPLGLPLTLWAALIWLAGLLPWVARFAPIYLRPRIDGKPG
ncbi:MAG: NnrS family protein [Gammaproteobacteria bacterium]